jgi:prepilin-type processing-associated H-X9-DG protein
MIELLVVVALLGVLLGLLLPSIGQVRSAGRSARCASNLRQMAMAAAGYSAVHDVFPPALRYALRDDGLHIVAWDWETTASGMLVGPGPLWSIPGDPGSVQQCPEHAGASNFADPTTGYNYNTTYLGAESPFPYAPGWGEGWERLRWGARPHACRRSASCALFGDGGIAAGVANKFMRAPMNSVEGDLSMVYAGAQAFRHGRCSNVAWVDSHVSGVCAPRKGAHATEELLRGMGYPGNGFLSDDDSAYDPG